MDDKMVPPPYPYIPPANTYPTPPANNNQYPQSGQYNPNQGQYNPYQGQYNPQNQYQQHPAVIVQQQPNVVLVAGHGNCPNCRNGFMRENYGFCAWFLAIFFFPIGILCCLAMRERRCSSCGYTI